MKKPQLKCAIYTRKSSDEGLDQDFNSLDAQRESCEAYITSQKAEGWSLVQKHYDDGGFSGGTLERPVLEALLNDIRAGGVNIVVVYKIDRLTRSLMDFAKLVEVFDEYGVTFVSITQSFNTTTSMGRLTLNVLLSFAQFEREVAGERRHTIAHIGDHASHLDTENMVSAIKKITVREKSLNIKISTLKLAGAISEQLKIALPNHDYEHDFETSYQTRVVKDGSVIVEKHRDTSNPLDLPSPELKNLIQGIIWRDDHFGGMTIDAIAKRDGIDRSKIGKVIRGSFDTLETLLIN